MAKLVYNYLADIDELKGIAKENSEKILGAIDIDALLDDPEGYLAVLGVEFAQLHTDEILKAQKAGEKFAEAVWLRSK